MCIRDSAITSLFIQSIINIYNKESSPRLSMIKSFLVESPGSRLLSEQTPGPCSKSSVKSKFVEIDRAKVTAHIKDLEESLMINKDLLEKMIDGSDINEVSKSLLISLNRENVNLLRKVKEITKERDELRCKLLITEQMIESFVDSDSSKKSKAATKGSEARLFSGLQEKSRKTSKLPRDQGDKSSEIRSIISRANSIIFPKDQKRNPKLCPDFQLRKEQVPHKVAVPKDRESQPSGQLQ
eukprot:TRINITY_DN12422_c0_g1_i10.p1 TRINITY_DN12422_c0_g1~~TRINITY_DN12422_c0_g1_i10.p1  ORF type:complete len:240 (-),score=20.59 TRINITY_DN12422_c0_g1_i10:612-1331(-)